MDNCNVVISDSNKTVVRNFSISINKGEIHTLVGKNGSGKSSLCLALAGHQAYKILGNVFLKGVKYMYIVKLFKHTLS